MNKLVAIGTAAKALGVSTSTLRRWETKGRLRPARTEGGQRRYDLAALFPQADGAGPPRRTIAYARVSSRGQKQDLDRQQQVLELYCAGQGWLFEVIADLGSGMNYHKTGLKRLLDEILATKSTDSYLPTKIACYASGPSWYSPFARRKESRSSSSIRAKTVVLKKT